MTVYPPRRRRENEDSLNEQNDSRTERPRIKRNRPMQPPPVVVNVGGPGNHHSHGLGMDENGGGSDQNGVSLAPGEPVLMRTMKQKHTRRDEVCWGCICRFGWSEYDTSKPFHAELLQLHVRLQDDDKEEMYFQLAEYHRLGIAAAAARLGQKCTPWPMDMVKCHLEWHIIDEYTEICKTVDGLRNIEHVMEDMLVRNLQHSDGRREWVVDRNTARAHERIVTQKLAALRLMRTLRRGGSGGGGTSATKSSS